MATLIPFMHKSRNVTLHMYSKGRGWILSPSNNNPIMYCGKGLLIVYVVEHILVILGVG
jgi:hypothetical protein